MSNNHNTPSNPKPPPNFPNPPNNHHPQMGVAGNYQNQNLMQQPFMPNMQQPRPPFMNPPNQLHMPHMGGFGFGPQNNGTFNPMFPVHGQGQGQPPQMNLSQIQGQILAQNIVNLLQQPNMNMNMSMPNAGQFSAPYPMQNMNQQQLPMQMQRQNPSQPVPYGMHPGQQQPMFGFPPNQVPPRPMVPQNPMFSGNSQFGAVPGNQVRPQIGPNPAAGNSNGFVSGPFPSQPLQGNSSVPHNTNNAQSSAFRNSHSQENPNSNINTNFANSNWKGSPNKNFKNKQNRGGSQGGFQKSKFRDNNNKGNMRAGFQKDREDRGPNNEKAGTFGLNSEEHQQQPKRSYSVIYSEQEILQWRDTRRKNHPSRGKIEKKQSEQPKNSKCIDREVLQRELKEVLAKQAELGIEVAEIPSYYLKNAANQGIQSEEKETTFTDKRKFKNKSRRNQNKRRWNSKKQKLADTDFLKNKKKPTLLQKLLSADIKRDQSYLFQVFRFMTANSFLKDYPDKPLVYPPVLVKEMGYEVYDGKKHLHGGKDAVEDDGAKGIVERFEESNDDDGDNGDGMVEFEEEEGEIVE
ncbi:unnamed protein product [Lathyrus sativus]|nr:unnamed protein product [Lathyrus sativus]